jgi:6-phosphofructokinase 1
LIQANFLPAWSVSCGGSRDAKGRPLPENVAAYLASLVSRQLKVRARSEKPGILCRAFSLCQSPVDAAEARAIGRFAFAAARRGETDKMVAIFRLAGKRYRSLLGLVHLTQVANQERHLPASFFSGQGQIRPSYGEDAAPLIGEPLEPPISL